MCLIYMFQESHFSNSEVIKIWNTIYCYMTDSDMWNLKYSVAELKL